MMQTGTQKRTLYLIPSTLGDMDPALVLPRGTVEVMNSLSHFAVENERTARRFLIRAGYNKPLSAVYFYILDEHTEDKNIPGIFDMSGDNNLGILSEAGAPAVADPGASLVMEAHRRGIRVVPLTGPSSVLLALMASGLNGQNFSFNGYLPVKDTDRSKSIRFFEKRSQQENQAQVFIEAPYRNGRLLKALIENLNPETMLCIAANLTAENEKISTRKAGEWKYDMPDIDRQPSIFIIQLFPQGRP
jgi:16S rRNA (cytidine1402-2'-O)-methyltransferase